MYNLKGKSPRRQPEVQPIPNIAEQVFQISDTKEKLYKFQNDIIDVIDSTLDEKLDEVDEKISEFKNEVVETRKAVRCMLDDAVEIISEIKTGPPGKDADEEAMEQRLLAQFPTIDEEGIEQRVIAKVSTLIPKIDPNEKVEIDPMSVIEKIMTLPDEQKKKLKFKTENVDGLSQTLRAMQSQLGKGYLHGGGLSNITGLITAGSNITITGSGTSTSPYNISSVSTVGPGTTNEIAYFNTPTSILSLTTATYPSLTELSYVKGVTSAIQTQLNALSTAYTLAGVSALSTNTAKSLYTMTSTIPVEFRRSGGSTLMYLDETNGRVGFGTNAPGTRFHVDKSSQVPGSSTPTGAFLVTDLGYSNFCLELGTANASSYGYIQPRNYISSTFYNLALNPSGGNVSIGTGTIPALLTVGDTYNSGLALQVTGSNSGSGSTIADFKTYGGTSVMTLFGQGNLRMAGSDATISGLKSLIITNTSGTFLEISTAGSAGTIASPLYPALNFDGYASMKARISAAEMSANTGKSYLRFEVSDTSNVLNEIMRITDVSVGIGVTSPTAVLHLRAGTATASTAPLKFTSGTNLTTAEAGGMEYNGTNLFFTRTGTTREGVLVGNAGAPAPSTTATPTFTSYYGGNTKAMGDPVGWFSIVDNAGVTRKVPYY